jgi:hypothetical protein
MNDSNEKARYIVFAAKLAFEENPMPNADKKRASAFMKSHPNMLAAWREYGMNNTGISYQLRKLGFPVSAGTVRNLMPSIVEAVDSVVVKAIVAQMQSEFMRTRKKLVAQADAAVPPATAQIDKPESAKSAAQEAVHSDPKPLLEEAKKSRFVEDLIDLIESHRTNGLEVAQIADQLLAARLWLRTTNCNSQGKPK